MSGSGVLSSAPTGRRIIAQAVRPGFVMSKSRSPEGATQGRVAGCVAPSGLRVFPDRNPGLTPRAIVGRPVGAEDSLRQLREDVALAEDLEFLAVHLDVGAAVLAVQDGVADLDREGDAVAVVVELAGTGGDDLPLLRLLLGGVRQQDAAGGLLLGLSRLDHHAVVERLQGQGGVFLGHGWLPCLCRLLLCVRCACWPWSIVDR